MDMADLALRISRSGDMTESCLGIWTVADLRHLTLIGGRLAKLLWLLVAEFSESI